MPWKIILNETGQFCVHKLDADGRPTELVTCHDTQEAAEAHLSALYAHETPGKTAIKALNDSGRIGGYLVVFGSSSQRDLQGEYFTPDTDLGLDWYDRRPVLYHHGLDGEVQASVVGTIDHLKADSVGVWAEAQLDLRHRYIQALQRLVKQGALGWSSGSLPHLVITEADGKIKRWPIIEGSMTPAPAEPRQTDINFVKTAYAELGLDITKLLPASPPAALPAPEEPEAKEAAAAKTSTGIPVQHAETKEVNMNPLELILQLIDALLTAKPDWQLTPDERQALAQQVASGMELPTGEADAMATVLPEVALPAMRSAAAVLVRDTVTQHFARKAQAAETQRQASAKAMEDAMKAAPPAANPLPAFTGGGQPHRIEVAAKYQNLSPLDMSYLAIMRKGATGGRWFADPEFYRELADKAGKSVDAGRLAVSPETAVALKSVARGEWAGLGLKANELNHSTQASYGDEWVPDLWSNDLWRRARQENVVLPLFRTVEMPSNPYELPIEGGDPTVYYVPETTAETELTIAGSGAVIPDSKIGSGKVQMTAKKLALRVGFSSELEEDSIIPVVSIYREQADRAIMDAVDFLLLNGDDTTAASGNINSDDQAPTAGSRYLAFNGLLHSALVEDTSRAVDALGVAPTLQLVRRMRFAMPYEYALRTGDLAYIVGGEVYHKLLNIDEFLTVDKLGANATVMKGQIGSIDGSPVLTTAQMAAAEADGKINTASPSSTLFGRAVCVYKPNWYVGYRRQVKVDVSYIPYYDAYQLTATIRLAFVHFDNDSASVLYDLAI